ncbi:MAG: hypothetical protein Q9227_003814 [Pyrenula ochraceoflavens]
MIKVAIAGTNGLAQLISYYIATNTSHQFIILSRHSNAGLTAKGWQVLPVNYNNPADLQYKLAGVDTVISTVSGQAQLNLIDAAAAMQVRRFMPSEFEGTPAARPFSDPLDAGRSAALAQLQQYAQQGMSYSVMTCGLFYERFGPGGMAAAQIGLSSGIAGEGQFMMDFKGLRAQIPLFNSLGEEVYVCMTSAQDVARYVVAALDLPSWPTELRLLGDRLSVGEIVQVGEQLWGGGYFLCRPFSLLISALSRPGFRSCALRYGLTTR